MTQPIQTTAEGMGAAAFAFVSAYEDIDKIMKDLRIQMGNLRDTWKGQSSIAFDQAMVHWGTEFDKILKQMDDMADKLTTGGKHTEQANDFAIQQGSFFKG